MKHGYVSDLKDYPFSSFPALLHRQGREPLARQFHQYADYQTLRLDEDDY